MKSKIKTTPVVASTRKIDDEMPIVSNLMRQKIPIEFTDTETLADDKEEKSGDESDTAEDSEEAAAEELSLDEEELNPFQDRWEE